ncbi:hypothetical protein NBRC3280_3082 [Acetobacter pasteurianus NBRC 3280]|uniref:Uncharacterized protein n=1 Tax=Acetobacter pasteurianus NBRC 3278 TaxID=1226660 RepID=A0A401X863_ACEPA|nr:hypothetical protein [Acetobacter pasteurianus]QHM92384.1 hypothetical protein FCN51_12965 [Acetobacter pasteurianus]GCD60463.1 hypothetical protein NBRC3277_3038 [Acetobacter pasteurianus NBRC 3277]GCD64004.1 hypothetical protein NBRC3278_3097 [Acetobacter pasteurianus NBRC 3278]GCD70447.1 hypothetical protein NBRC3280_3082 [Acetobacter pasteurianus NBRC 3280]
MNNMTQASQKLPIWKQGTIRLIDIAPGVSGRFRLRQGLPVSLAWYDILFREGHIRVEINGQVCHGHLEEVPGETGGCSHVIDDRLFNALFPHGQTLPLCLAGYNMAFLHTLLGAPWDEPPYLLCLYKMSRMFDLGKTGDYTLAEIAEYTDPEVHVPWYENEALTRVELGRVVLRKLLSMCRLNMMVALSGAKVPPPPTSEPFGKIRGWQQMEGGVFRDFE